MHLISNLPIPPIYTPSSYGLYLSALQVGAQIILCYDRCKEAVMNIIPIQVTDEGVLIPKTYLQNSDAVDVVITPNYVLVKPRRQPAPESTPMATPQVQPVPTAPNVPATVQPSRSPRRNPLVGHAHPSNQGATAVSETVLEHEADQRYFKLVNLQPGRDFELVP